MLDDKVMAFMPDIMAVSSEETVHRYSEKRIRGRKKQQLGRQLPAPS